VGTIATIATVQIAKEASPKPQVERRWPSSGDPDSSGTPRTCTPSRGGGHFAQGYLGFMHGYLIHAAISARCATTVIESSHPLHRPASLYTTRDRTIEWVLTLPLPLPNLSVFPNDEYAPRSIAPGGRLDPQKVASNCINLFRFKRF